MAEAIDHSSRSHAFLSASSAHRWLNCTMAPISEAQYIDEGSAFAAEGTLAHEIAQIYLEHLGEGMPELQAALEEFKATCPDANHITQQMYDCAEEYAAYISELMHKGDHIFVEHRLDFSKWVPEGFGTADCIIVGGNRIVVVDYKYGQGVKVDAVGNPQMMLYGLGTLEEFSIVYDLKVVEMHIFQPRMNNISPFKMGVSDLVEWADKEISCKAEDAYNGRGEFKAGEHCKFCKHAGQCRELARSTITYVTDHGLMAAVPHLADYEYAEYWAMKKQIETWMKRIEQTIMNRLLDGDAIPGLKLVEGRSSRAWSNAGDVVKALEAAGVPADKMYTAPELLTPAALEKSLGKKKVAELVSSLIETKHGSPTCAEESDKRPAYDPTHDFADLGD